MKNIVKKDSFIAKEIESMSILLKHGQNTSPGDNVMFDADSILNDRRVIIDEALHPSRHSKKISIRKMINAGLRSDWIRVFGNRVINSEYLAVDNNINLKVFIDILLQIDGKRYVCKIYYLPSKLFNSVAADGPLAKDILALNAALYMTSCFDGIIIYQHGLKCKVFHVEHSASAFRPVIKRCHMLNDYLLLGKIPESERAKVK